MQQCTGIPSCPIDKPLKVNIIECKVNVLVRECFPKICYNFDFKTMRVSSHGRPGTGEEIWSENVLKCGAHCDSCVADKCLETRIYTSSNFGDEETVKAQCFKEDC